MGQTLVLVLALVILSACSVYALKWYDDNFPEEIIPTRRQMVREAYHREPIRGTRLFDGAKHGWPW